MTLSEGYDIFAELAARRVTARNRIRTEADLESAVAGVMYAVRTKQQDWAELARLLLLLPLVAITLKE